MQDRCSRPTARVARWVTVGAIAVAALTASGCATANVDAANVPGAASAAGTSSAEVTAPTSQGAEQQKAVLAIVRSSTFYRSSSRGFTFLHKRLHNPQWARKGT